MLLPNLCFTKSIKFLSFILQLLIKIQSYCQGDRESGFIGPDGPDLGSPTQGPCVLFWLDHAPSWPHRCCRGACAQPHLWPWLCGELISWTGSSALSCLQPHLQTLVMEHASWVPVLARCSPKSSGSCQWSLSLATISAHPTQTLQDGACQRDCGCTARWHLHQKLSIAEKHIFQKSCF